MNTTEHLHRLVGTEEACRLINDAFPAAPVTPVTLRKWRQRHYGPRWLRFGRFAYYDPADIAAWLDAAVRPGRVAG